MSNLEEALGRYSEEIISLRWPGNTLVTPPGELEEVAMEMRVWAPVTQTRIDGQSKVKPQTLPRTTFMLRYL